MGLSGKLKRKDIDQVNDDFSDFSLSSPATKIRRRDADLPPIIEEEESSFLPPENQERAIVPFTPSLLHGYTSSSDSDIPLLRAPSTLSLSLNSDLLSGFKNQLLRETDMNSAEHDESKSTRDRCVAVVPWVPFQVPSMKSRDKEVEVGESMEASDEMDVEEESSNNNEDVIRMEAGPGYEYGHGVGLKPSEAQALHPWPHQHCMIPQPPQNLSTPITWFR